MDSPGTASVPGFEVTTMVRGADNVFYFIATATAASGGRAGGTDGIAVGDQQVFKVDFTPPVAGGTDGSFTPVLAIPSTFERDAAQTDEIAVSDTREIALAGTFNGTLNLGQGVTQVAGSGTGGSDESETVFGVFHALGAPSPRVEFKPVGGADGQGPGL